MVLLALRRFKRGTVVNVLSPLWWTSTTLVVGGGFDILKDVSRSNMIAVLLY